MFQNNGEIHFFTGKGGVGKSTLALAKALTLSEQGYRTLLVEHSHLNTMSRFLGFEVGSQPQAFRPNLDVASWDGEDCLQEYVKHSVKIKLIFDIFYRSKAMNALIKAAPALKEISFLGYLTSHFRDVKPHLDYDKIVVDAPSTGHFMACLMVPKSLLSITSVGPMGFHCKGILDVLQDPKKVKVHTVFLPEDLVVNEQKQLSQNLSQKLNIQPEIWLNRSFLRAYIKLPSQSSGILDSFNLRFIRHLRQNLENEKILQKEMKDNDLKVIPEILEDDILQVSERLSKQLLDTNFAYREPV